MAAHTTTLPSVQTVAARLAAKHEAARSRPAAVNSFNPTLTPEQWAAMEAELGIGAPS